MNTPAHLIFAAAVWARPGSAATTWAALAGALAPDLSLYVMASVSVWLLNIPPQVVFEDLYFSEGWQRVFAVDNSFLLWGALFGLGWARDWPLLRAFAGAGVLHLAFDFPLHHDDGRPHFWPLSDWVFHSPLSYWDRGHFGGIVGPIEMLVSLMFCGLLLRRFRGLWPRMAICGVATIQLVPVVIWVFVFATDGA